MCTRMNMFINFMNKNVVFAKKKLKKSRHRERKPKHKTTTSIIQRSVMEQNKIAKNKGVKRISKAKQMIKKNNNNKHTSI